MAVDVLAVVRLGVCSRKKIKQQRIKGVLNVTLQWWNMMHLLESRYLQQEERDLSEA
tara:strand:- start:3449 stop:3619 length:171 start_codon:yes stop_codon:yes gene_type:complete